jgi:hypothetical protein
MTDSRSHWDAMHVFAQWYPNIGGCAVGDLRTYAMLRAASNTAAQAMPIRRILLLDAMEQAHAMCSELDASCIPPDQSSHSLEIEIAPLTISAPAFEYPPYNINTTVFNERRATMPILVLHITVRYDMIDVYVLFPDGKVLDRAMCDAGVTRIVARAMCPACGSSSRSVMLWEMERMGRAAGGMVVRQLGSSRRVTVPVADA